LNDADPTLFFTPKAGRSPEPLTDNHRAVANLGVIPLA